MSGLRTYSDIHPLTQGLPDVAGVPGITLDKPQSPLCVALLIDYVKPDDVIAGITSNGVLVLDADTGSSPVNG